TGGTLISGATSTTYTPPTTTVGTTYYYVVATNGTCTTTSDAVSVTVTATTTCTTGCNPNTGIYADDPDTIEYDNIVSLVGATYLKQADGTVKTWGNDGTNAPDYLVPTTVNSTTRPNITGDVLKFGLGDFSGNQDNFILTTTGLYGNGLVINSTTPAPTTTYGVSGTNTYGLPMGVTPDNVKIMASTALGLAIVSCDGQIWIMGLAGQYGDGTGVDTTTQWHRVKTNATTTLDNVVAVRLLVDKAIAMTDDGKLYTWGDNTYLGDGSPKAARTYATEMTLPTGATPKMIGIMGNLNDTYTTYTLLTTDGLVYLLGNDVQGTTATSWVKAQKPAAMGGGDLDNIAWINTVDQEEVYYDTPGSPYNTAALTTDGKLWTEIHTSSPNYMPGALAAGATYDATKLNQTDKIVNVEVAAYKIVIIREDGRVGFMGYRENGSFADGTTTYEEVTEFMFPTNTEVTELEPCGVDIPETCVKPGASGTPLYTKVGILTKGSITNSTGSIKWPENVPNGHIVMDSAEKGFVITHMTTLQRDALTPVDGMLIYNTDLGCVQLYRGTAPGVDTSRTGWNCIERGCNE
ncbi:MAG: hypothetical protein QM564_05065, partial [Bergeyella sp.]